MPPILLTKSSYLLPFADYLHQHGQSSNQILKKSKLPGDCLENPQKLVPSIAIGRFMDYVSRLVGDPNISLEVIKDI